MTPREKIENFCGEAIVFCEKAKTAEKADTQLYLTMALAKIEAALNEIPALWAEQQRNEQKEKFQQRDAPK